MSCPSCKSNKIKILETFDIDLIKRHYLETGLDVSYLFKNINTLDFIECCDCNLKFFNPVVLGDDKFYEHLQQEDWYFLHEDKTEYEFSTKYIKPNDKLLDVGSGRGVFKKYIDCEFYQGLELSTKAIALARQDGVNVIPELTEKHCEDKKGFYDVVVLFQVLEHIEDIKSFITSALKCLKKGGKLIIAVPNNDAFIKTHINYFLNLPPHHQLHWNENSLLKLAYIYNLKVVEIFKEKVTNVHKNFYYKTLKTNILMKLTGHNNSICTNLPQLNILYRIFAEVIRRLLQCLSFHKYADGQTIIVVYEKE